jgi:hypothetical protein
MDVSPAKRPAFSRTIPHRSGASTSLGDLASGVSQSASVMLSEGAEALTHAGTAIYTTSTGVLYLPCLVCRCRTCEPGIGPQPIP